MGRKRKRQRDPDRSHGRRPAVAPTPRHRAHGSVATQGQGWFCWRLEASVAQELQRLLNSTRLTGPAFQAHSEPGQQGNDLAMVQRPLHGSGLWRTWKGPLRAAIASMHGLMCPCCRSSLAADHELVAADLNVIRPGAALWPHIDASDVGGPTVLLLLQPAAAGGVLHVACKPGEGGVRWRAVGEGRTLARRAQDTVAVPLCECGDVCALEGEARVHEVTKVHGESARVSIALSLRCSRES